MGTDFLDCCFRLEKEFAPLKLDSRDLRGQIDERTGKPFATAGDVLKWVETSIERSGLTVPTDSWPRVRKCIATTVSVPVEEVSHSSRMVQDLGFT